MRTILPIMLVLAGCDAQVDADHRGTALAELSGMVRNTRVMPTGAAEVLAFWYADESDPTGDQHGFDLVAVEGAFPAQFTLSIYEPPDPVLYTDIPGAPFAVAFLIAALAGTDYSSERAFQEGLLGMDTEHLLVYVPHDIPQGSLTSYLLRSTPTAGYHLYGVHRPTDAEIEARQLCIDGLGEEPTLPDIFMQCGGFPQFDDFVPLDDDLAAPLEIELVDDPSTIEAPNWT